MVAAELLSKLRCPRCLEGGLEMSPAILPERSPSEGVLLCQVCKARYPIRSDIPILLPQAATTEAEPEVDNTASAISAGVLPERLRRARSVLRNQGLAPLVQKAWRALRTEAERRVPTLRQGPVFSCPCCGEREPFLRYRGRPYAQCPRCGAKERDRFLLLVLDDVLTNLGHAPIVLHSAPESSIRHFLSKRASEYVPIDLTMGLSSYAGELSAAADLTRLPFLSESFDLVVACHVLEHIADDRNAIREVRRVLKPGGIALLPVPVVHDGPTVEYGKPRLAEEMHVRAPGVDYFDRFEELGLRVAVRRSSDYPSEHQLRSYHGHGTAERRDGTLGVPDSVGSEQYIPICLRPGGEREYPFAWRH